MNTALRTISLLFLMIGLSQYLWAAVGVRKNTGESQEDPFATKAMRKAKAICPKSLNSSDSTNKKRLPLAVLKGTFFAKEYTKNVPIRLQVIDKISQQIQHFVFDPDPQTGEYRIFVPVNRTYEIHIQPEGYKAHVVQVYIPDYTYSYEFSRELKLEYISASDKIIAKRISVGNSRHRFLKVSEVKTNTDIFYDPLVSLNEIIFERGEIEKLDILSFLSKSSTTHPDENPDAHFDEMFENIDSAIETGNIAYINRMREDAQLFHESFYGLEAGLEGKEILRAEFLYAKNQFEIVEQHQNNLDKVISLLQKESNLLIKIEGFADSDGSENINKEISYKRALSVLRYLKSQNIQESKFIVEGMGVSQQLQDKSKNRRVTLVVFKLPSH